MNRLQAIVSALPFLLLACGSSPPAPATAATTSGASSQPGQREGHKQHHEDHGDLPAPVRAFHDELAPLWHAEKGAERTKNTCDKAAALRDKATATNDKDLVEATSALVSECAKDGRPDFEAKFAAVHKQFHKLAKHEDHK